MAPFRRRACRSHVNRVMIVLSNPRRGVVVEAVRETPAELVRRYWAEGLWSDETLGTMLAEGLGRNRQQPFRVWSERRPYVGTYGSILEMAQRFAGGLR